MKNYKWYPAPPILSRLLRLSRYLAAPLFLARKILRLLRQGGGGRAASRHQSDDKSEKTSGSARLKTVVSCDYGVLSRKDKAFCKINRCGLGLEIGPSHNPLAPKSEGFNVRIVDHCSASELREKYRDHGVALNNIEEVDFVWRDEPLHKLIGREGVYDFILASHVIEHIADALSFLRECSRLLKPDGVLSLIIPDQRYCFDYFRWPSSTGDVLQAFIEKRSRHPAGVVFDYLSNAATCDGKIAWGENAYGEIKLLHSFNDAVDGWHAAVESIDYIDVHEWRFTPYSFRLVLQDLRQMGLLDLSEVCAFPTEGCEFFVSLSKSGALTPTVPRQDLLVAIQQEIGCSLRMADRRKSV